MRILFAGSPDIAVPSLILANGEHQVVGVLTNPDSTRGRGRSLSKPAVKESALELGLRVLQPESLDKNFRKTIADLNPEILVAVAFGRIFGPRFLDLFPRGGVNLHPSLLPLYRGCSPINAAILNGDGESGITIQRLAPEMDSGDILVQESFPLDGTETAEELTSFCAQKGALLLSHALKGLEAGTLKGREQDHRQATYCGFINKEDGKIAWNKSALEIERSLRAYSPWPGIFTFYRGLKLNIHRANVYTGDQYPRGEVPGTVLGMDKKEGILIQTGSGILAVQELQLQAKKMMDFRSFSNGNKDFTGAYLGGE